MARRILGLGQAAQRVLMAIYRAGFPGQPPAVELAERMGCARFWQAVARACDKDLVPRRGGRLELTAAGRSAVTRIAPLFLALWTMVFLGCIADLAGPPFTEESAPEEPEVIVLVTGEPQYPDSDVCEAWPMEGRRQSSGPDAGHP